MGISVDKEEDKDFVGGNKIAGVRSSRLDIAHCLMTNNFI